jgi:hypothetical protein
MNSVLIEFLADSRTRLLRQSLLQIASGMPTSLHDSTYALDMQLKSMPIHFLRAYPPNRPPFPPNRFSVAPSTQLIYLIYIFHTVSQIPLVPLASRPLIQQTESDSPSVLHYGDLYRPDSGFFVIYLCKFDAHRQELHYRTPNRGSAFFIRSTKGALTRFGMPELYICIVPGFGHINFVHSLVRVDNFER